MFGTSSHSEISRRAVLLGVGSSLALGTVSTADTNAQPQRVEVRNALLEGYIKAKQQYGFGNGGSGVAVDFSLSSRIPRLHILNADNSLQKSVLVGHGKGSDPNHTTFATRFNGALGSNTSVLGALRGSERYYGKHGLSLRLDGLQPSNKAARRRYIVIHQADYLEDRFVVRIGKPGRSLGCFVLRQVDLEPVLSALEQGGILWAAR